MLGEAGVPSAPVNDVAAALEDPQARARGSVVETDHPRLGPVRQVASPLRLGDEPPLRRAPFRGEHTEAVLAEVCDYSPERLRELAEAGSSQPAEVGPVGLSPLLQQVACCASALVAEVELLGQHPLQLVQDDLGQYQLDPAVDCLLEQTARRPVGDQRRHKDVRVAEDAERQPCLPRNSSTSASTSSGPIPRSSAR